MNSNYADDNFEKLEKQSQGSKISDITNDLPDFYVKPKEADTSTTAADDKQNISEQTYDSVYSEGKTDQTYDSVSPHDDDNEYHEFVGGEPIEVDTHTLVRSAKKQLFTRDPELRGSMVGMKEGVPGIYSGYERKERPYSKLERTSSESSSDSNPVRPPRRPRLKSDPSTQKSSKDYDKLWAVNKTKCNAKDDDDDDEHVYSLLGEAVGEGDSGKTEDGIIFSSSPIKDIDKLSDDRKDNILTPVTKDRPLSTVVFPISPVEEASGSDSDWGSDFDDVSGDFNDNNDDDLYEVVGDMSQKMSSNRDSVVNALTTVREQAEEALKTKPHFRGKPLPPIPTQPPPPPLPPLPPIPFDSNSLTEQDDDSLHYVDIGFDGQTLQHPSMPILNSDATEDQVKRYQIIKYIFENEKAYMVTLHSLIQDYERPLKDKKIISQESVRVIFQHLQEIEQCHQLFNMALCARMDDWDITPKIGDIIYASFSNSMVLKAYSNYVKNFTKAMEVVKHTCRLVPSFLKFLKARLSKSPSRQTFYDLLKKPLVRFPQLVVLLQELLRVTSIDHCDRMSLQMALTQLECLSELICEKRRDIEMRYRVSQLDRYFSGLSKPLFSTKRYLVRHDNMLLCKVVDGQVVKTKLRRLFLLSDLLVCASMVNRSKAVNKLSKKRYRVKWCVPIAEVDIVDVGSGILVNIDNKTTTTIKYTHPVSSPRPGGKDLQEELETLQHDLAVIGQIAGLVGTLRKKYEIIDEQKVSDWYRNVKETIENETEVANMRWLELALPTKDKKTATYLFKLSHPRQKMEWTTELDNAKLRLGIDNNPGWYIQEDETGNTGSMGILRRNLPLLGNKLPLFMVEAKFTIECILEVTPPGCVKPILWIFSGNDHAGQITLMEMNMSAVPHVVENFIACNSRILSAEVVKDEPNRFNDTTEQKALIWCGTMSGSIHVYNTSDDDHEEVAVARLRDAVLCFKHVQSKVFCGLADGTVACFRRKTDASWDFDNPTVVCLGKSAVLTVTEAAGRLWCACENYIFIMDITTLGIEHRITTGDRTPVKHLVSYGTGVWASVWKTSKLHLYHSETYECLQSISVTTPLLRMRNDVDSRIQGINIEKAHVTCLQARGGLLWVGTDVGIIMTYPLPRLGGVPQVSGRPCVSFHGHVGSVRCLHAFRVERNIKYRGETSEDFDARSLFYVDPFDEAASGLNIPAIIKDSLPETAPSTATPSSNEPFYFTVIPDATPKSTAAASYEDWLKSFGRNIKEVDPLLSEGDKNRGRGHNEGYDSDESMDSDTEFSFIEDKGRRIPARTKKSAPVFSVEIKPDANDGTVGTVSSKKEGTGTLPSIAEVNFADMMSNFEGFNEDTQGEKPELNKSISSEFVMVEKTNSGYEEPIPAPERIVKDPYAKVNKDKVNDSEGGPELLHSFSIDGTVVKAENKEPDQSDVEKYRNEPLPELPVETLYQKAKEWTSDSEQLESNVVGGESEPRTDEMNLDEASEFPAESKSESNDDAVALVKDECSSDDSKEGALKSEDKKTENMTDDDVNDKRESGNIEDVTESCVEPGPVSPQMLISESCSSDAAEEKNYKCGNTPLSIKVTDTETQSVVEGSIDVDGEVTIETKENILLRNETDQVKDDSDEIDQTKRETASLPCASHPKTPVASSNTLPRQGDGEQRQATAETPKNLDLSGAGLAEEESIYTPLLNKTGESYTSTMSAVGTRDFESEMALSSSLARENSSHGYYKSLVSVSNRDVESRMELLMKPMYVLSVGAGYLDLRKKQKLGSGIDFFKNLTASEPEPKLLIWKIIS